MPSLRRLPLLATLGVAGVLVLPTASSTAKLPDPIPKTGFTIGAFEDDAGQPSVWAVLDGESVDAQWSACPPDSDSCFDIAGDLDALVPGDVPAGTSYKASVTQGSQTLSAQTLPWQGTVKAVAPPTLTGTPVVGSTVTPHAGSWSGGWDTDFDGLQVVACPRAVASDCTLLSAQDVLPSGNASGATTLDDTYVGWYLFAFDARTTAAASSAVLLPPSPGDPMWGVGPLSPAPTVSQSAPLGPIVTASVVPPAPSPAPPAPAPAPAPPAPRTIATAQLAARAVSSKSRVALGSVTCSAACSVHVRARGAGHLSSSAKLELPAGTSDLSVPRGRLHYTDHLKVSVVFGNHAIASGSELFQPGHVSLGPVAKLSTTSAGMNLGKVRCYESTCHVSVVVEDHNGSHHTTTTRRILRHGRPKALVADRGDLTPGILTVTVTINGETFTPTSVKLEKPFVPRITRGRVF
jgi:hypothetical protein